MDSYICNDKHEAVFDESRMTDATEIVDVVTSSIKEITTTRPWPNVKVLNHPSWCKVNDSHFPNLVMVNGYMLVKG